VTTLLQGIYFTAAGLSLFASLAVTASMFMAERAPHSVRFWIITVAVSVFFALVGLLLVGIGRHLPAIGLLAQSVSKDTGILLQGRYRRLAFYMVVSGLMLWSLLLLIAYAILSRIDEGFSVFG
jgi:hypothetical protein